jgi:hypothetical protein
MAYEDWIKCGQAASDLAIAASRLRDADDALVTLGRELRETDADRGMPSDHDAERALVAARSVSMAYRDMREAEARLERLEPSGNPTR